MKLTTSIAFFLLLCTYILQAQPMPDATPSFERSVLVKIPESTGPQKLSVAISELMQDLSPADFGEDFLKKIAEAEKTHTSGEYIEHWPNGQIKIKAAFKNGYADGHIHGWYANGKEAFKGFFKEGIKLGIHISFRDTKPQRTSSQAALILVYNEQGQLHGEQITAYHEGSLESLTTYKNGVLHGQKIWSNIEGRRLQEWLYENGKLVTPKK